MYRGWKHLSTAIIALIGQRNLLLVVLYSLPAPSLFEVAVAVGQLVVELGDASKETPNTLSDR